MPRLAGIDIPDNKPIRIALRYIYGIGPKHAQAILDKAEIDGQVRAHTLTEDQLATIAGKDPGFVVRVMARVNSAAFGARGKVNDVQHACSLLGVRGLRNLALGLVVSDMIPTGSGGSLLWGMCHVDMTQTAPLSSRSCLTGAQLNDSF